MWQKELDLFVAELPELRAKNVVDADMICIAPILWNETCILIQRGESLREVCYRKEWVLVKDIALNEPLQQVPRHWNSTWRYRRNRV